MTAAPVASKVMIDAKYERGLHGPERQLRNCWARDSSYISLSASATRPPVNERQRSTIPDRQRVTGDN